VEGRVSSGSGKEVVISFQIRTLSAQDRKRIAFKALGICWGLSIATIPLPPIHWVTVPGFFLFGIYYFFRKLKEPEHFEAITFSCPECSKEVKVEPQVVKKPFDFVCPHCRYGLKLHY
jgi:DNA-directed RNA polymerase subunit RPC12/RpoP